MHHHSRHTRTLAKLILLTLCLLVVPILGPSRAYPAQKKKDQKQAQGQDDSLKLHTDLVLVNVTVTDGAGHYVHGLAANDFTLQEEGSRQKIDSLAAEESPFAAAILVDLSGSMEYRFGLVRGAAAGFLDHLGGDDQVAMYGFNNKVKLMQEFSNARDVTDNLWDARAENETRIYDCIEEAVTALAARPEKRRAILLISDGCDTFSKASLNSSIKKALAAGVTIYSVDLTDDDLLIGAGASAAPLRRGIAEMEEMARQTGGTHVHSPQGEKLEESFANIVEELHNQYTLSYYSTNEKRDGKWRNLAIRVARPGADVRSKRGYYAPKD